MIIFFVGFLIRFFPVRTDSTFHYWDETVYLQHAEIWGGYRENNYNEFGFRPPLLPLLIALGYRVYHSVITAHFIVAIVSSLGIITTFFLSKLIFDDDRVALLAALIFCANPLHITLSHDILVDSMLPVFCSVVVIFLLLSFQKNNSLYYLLAGIFFGLSILLKFTALSLLFPIVFVMFFEKLYRRKTKNIKISIILFRFLRERGLILFFLGAFLTLLPYMLLFNFFSPFVTSFLIITESVSQPWYFFLVNFNEIIPLPFAVGILFYFITLAIKKGTRRYEVYLLIFAFIPFLLLHIIVHKEIRYATPILPFFTIVSARGFENFFDWFKNKRKLLIFLIVCFLVLTFLLIEGRIKDILGGNLFIENQTASPMAAAFWIKASTSSDTPIYCNFECPPIAYYSLRKTYPLPNSEKAVDEIMKEEGYLLLSSIMAESREPKLTSVMADKRFKLIGNFSDSVETIYIFKYTPRNIT
jgi:4-amino-4-deoxy-L-arabinose transferase-like glycosyltransferase